MHLFQVLTIALAVTLSLPAVSQEASACFHESTFTTTLNYPDSMMENLVTNRCEVLCINNSLCTRCTNPNGTTVEWCHHACCNFVAGEKGSITILNQDAAFDGETNVEVKVNMK